MKFTDIERTTQPNRLIGVAAIIDAMGTTVRVTIVVIASAVIITCIYVLWKWIHTLFIIFAWAIIAFFVVTYFAFYVRLGNKAIRGWAVTSVAMLDRAKSIESLNKLRLNNMIIEERIALLRRKPELITYAISSGGDIEYDDIKITGREQGQLIPPVLSLPSFVRYEDIVANIPAGHNLVGISETGVISKEDRLIGACVWVVGLSGTGKTSTTVCRVEERAKCGHHFYVADPHWFKDDSLEHAISGYQDLFLAPVGHEVEEITHICDQFLEEFQARKRGLRPKPFDKITIIVDEVNSLNDPQTKEEEKLLDKLKTIVRICGQEARNFMMGGIFISQQATGLYWIRNVALLIIVHKLLQKNQQELATNRDDKDFMDGMRLWPKGRTYVYGAGLEEGEGCLTLQQPYFEKEKKEVMTVEATPVISDEMMVRMAMEELDPETITVDRVFENVSGMSRAKVGRIMKSIRESSHVS